MRSSNTLAPSISEAGLLILGPCVLLCSLLFLHGCDDAQVVSANISKAADNFEVNRRVVFYNGITGEYILSIEGRCSITYDQLDKQLEVTCKTGEGQYKKHFLGLSDNVTYFAEQIDGIQASPYHYRVTFKPSLVVPNVNVR
jgi:hypothetical protein